MNINKPLLRKVVITLILVTASLVRLIQLGSVPPHLTPDEAALGYSAYSILKTGRDEHGTLLPFVFKSFGDFKPGLYVYLTVPFIATLGLTEIATRLPGALSGILAVFVLFKIMQVVVNDKKSLLPYIVAAVLALSPWHIMLSRGAWEVNVALTLTLIGTYYFLRAMEKSSSLIPAAAFFALTLLCYQGAKLSSVIVILLLSITHYKKLMQMPKRQLILSAIVGFVISIPILVSMFVGQAGRLAVFSVFSAPRPAAYLEHLLAEGNEQNGSISYYAFHNEPLNFARGILGRWFNHFSGRFLFFEGDWQNPRHSAPYVGMLHILDLPMILIGLFVIVKSRKTPFLRFIALWLVIAPLPAILSRDQVHAVRSLQMVIPLTVLIGYGVHALVSTGKFKSIVGAIVFFGYILSFVYFADAYFIHLPKLHSKYWEYGYKQAVQSILPIQSQYSSIIFQQSYSQPYIYFLFYGAYDPQKFQSAINDHFVESKYGDVGQLEQLDNISFKGIDWQVLRGKTGTLVVGDSERIPEADSQEGTAFRVISNIKHLDGKNVSLRIIDIK